MCSGMAPMCRDGAGELVPPGWMPGIFGAWAGHIRHTCDIHDAIFREKPGTISKSMALFERRCIDCLLENRESLYSWGTRLRLANCMIHRRCRDVSGRCRGGVWKRQGTMIFRAPAFVVPASGGGGRTSECGKRSRVPLRKASASYFTSPSGSASAARRISDKPGTGGRQPVRCRTAFAFTSGYGLVVSLRTASITSGLSW